MPELTSPEQVLQSLGGPTPNTSQGDVGSPSQMQYAIGGTTVEATPTPPPAVNLEGGRELLPKMDWAVKGVESGRRQFDSSGKIITSPAGALGISQIVPDPVRDKGVDLFDPDQNAAQGKKILGDLYDKYHDWNRALIAYNWGETRTNRWIDAGADPAKLPAQTRAYVPAVLAQLGMAPGAAFVKSKDLTSPEDVRDALKDFSATQEQRGQQQEPHSALDDETRTIAPLLTGDPGSGDVAAVSMSKEGQDEAASMLNGAVNGLAEIVTGPTQMGLEQVKPDWAKGMTDAINRMNEPYEAAIEAHPWANLTGRLIGTTVGIAAATRLLGAGEAALLPSAMRNTVQAALRVLPTSVKAAGVGGLLAGSSFNKDPDNASRIAESAIGMILGKIGSDMVHGVSTLIKNSSDRQVLQNYTQTLTKYMQGFEPSLSAVKDRLLSRAAAINQMRNTKYVVRDLAGQPLQGYPTGLEEGGGVAELLEQAAKGTADFNKGKNYLQSTAREVERKLGLDAERERFEQWKAEMQQYQDALTEYTAKRGSKLSPQTQALIAQNAQRRGLQTGIPAPPDPFLSRPIAAEDMAGARQIIEAGRRRSSTVAGKTQHGILKQRLDQIASQTAKQAGVDVAGYEQLQKAADSFNKRVVVPMRELLGGKTVAEARQSMTSAEAYDTVVGLARGHDREKQQLMYDLLGPGGRAEARKAVLHDMFSKSIESRGGTLDPTAFSKYLDERRTGLETLLGREEYTKLEGLAKIAQTMTGEVKRRGLVGMLMHHPYIASWAGMALWRGNWHEAGALTMGVLGMEMTRSMFQGMQRIPRIIGPLLPRAARTSVDSPEMQRIIRSIDAVMTAATRTGARVIPPATGGEPATSAGQIGGEMLGAVGSAFQH